MDNYSLSNMDKASILERMIEMMFLMAADWSYVKNTATHWGADYITDKFVIEAKNWDPLLYMRVQQFYEDVLARFLVLDPVHTKKWILVIPKLWAYGDNTEIFDLIDEYNIQLAEIELQYTTFRLNVVEHLFNIIYHQDVEKETVYIPEPRVLSRVLSDESISIEEHESFPVLDECVEHSFGSTSLDDL